MRPKRLGVPCEGCGSGGCGDEGCGSSVLMQLRQSEWQKIGPAQGINNGKDEASRLTFYDFMCCGEEFREGRWIARFVVRSGCLVAATS